MGDNLGKVAAVTRAWSIGEEGTPERLICEDLRMILSAGLHHFEVRDLKALRDYFSDGSGPASKAVVRKRMVELLMQHDPGREPNDDSDLSDATRFALTLFRATGNTTSLGIREARIRASVFVSKNYLTLDGKRERQPLGEDAVKKKGAHEYKLFKALIDEVVEMNPRTRLPLPGSATHDDANRDKPQGRPLPSINLAYDLYEEPDEDSLQEGFWWRDNTYAYIDQLAELRDVTLIAFAEGSSDIGKPRHHDLLRTTLLQRLRDLPDRSDAGDETAVQLIAKHCPPAYIGSILRETYRSPYRGSGSRNAESLLNADLQGTLVRSRHTGGFVSRAIALLALTLKRDRRAVEVMTSYYDADLAAAVSNRHRFYPELGGIDFHDLLDHEPTERSDEVPLIQLNGHPGDRSAQGLIVGEADFLTDEYVVAGGHPDQHMSRYALLARALTRGAAVFVGSSLDDAGVINALVATRHFQKRRYAILLPPAGCSAESDLTPEAQLALHDLLSKRYLHLGVVPIYVDFAQQVPQLLREVALRISPREHVPYRTRLDGWWQRWADLCGYDPEGESVGEISPELSSQWQQQLTLRCTELAQTLRPAPGEELDIEVWLRNHHRRELFLCAASGLQGPRKEVLGVRDAGPEDVVQRAFRTGELVARGLREKAPGFLVATSILLYEEPWNRLNVGVVAIRSNQEKGGLAQAARHNDALVDLERELKRVATELRL